MERTSLRIDGMSCGHCVRAVAQALQGLGVEVEQVEIGSATVSYDPARIRPEQIAGAIAEEGYTLHNSGRTP